MRNTIFFTFLFSMLLTLSACSPEEDANKTEVIEEGDRIFIMDATGKRWDVTHAVQNYGFDASRFEHGLGPNAITPINNPRMISPGQEGYPDQNQTFTILGTSLNGDARAYPLDVLIRHEMANEKFGPQHVAVAY